MPDLIGPSGFITPSDWRRVNVLDFVRRTVVEKVESYDLGVRCLRSCRGCRKPAVLL